MKSIITLLLLFISHLVVSQFVEKGAVIDSIHCDLKPEQSYALYIPSYYDSALQWPAIYVFEPAARGVLPVTKFKSVAEELGYLVFASNNSKNGSWDLSFESGDAMFVDTFSKFSIDPDRVYTSGFSGGSRVASAVAAITGKINGVIACGAGFASIEEYKLPKNSPVLYVAIVGNRDMNYQEHRQLEESLNENGIINNRIIFNAGHQWPYSMFLREAIYWIELQCLKRGQQSSKGYSIQRSYDLTKNKADSIAESGDYVLAAETYERLWNDYDGLLELTELSSIIGSIEKDKEYKRQSKKAERINGQEVNLRKELGDAFTELYFTKLNVGNDSTLKSMGWWERKVDFYKRLAKKDDFLTRNMALRLLNLIWARSAESSFNFMANNDYETALVLNKIWLYTEPNTWGKWNMAIILASMNNPEFYKYLQEVIDESQQFSKQAILKTPAFNNFLEEDKMKSLLSHLN
ncbi:MAG TPA: hypothetical protein PKL31_03320 [Fulvivirga sp.]|nr:hypothetical protein [Fulvivirga sp.]